jgi:hypothetical protein
MIKISHRGNLNGKNKLLENSPEYINLALSMGYDVEIDVWLKDGIIYLGHDDAQHIIDIIWLKERCDNLWVHCKNIESVVYFKNMEYGFNYFWHQSDDITLTSKNYLWTFPGKQITEYSIAVLPEIVNNWNIKSCIGICSDFIDRY